MTDLVATSSTVATGDTRWRQLVAEKIAPNATDYDIDYLAAICRRLELSPFTNPPQIWLIPRYDHRLRKDVFRPQVSVDGRLALAVRTGHVVGIEGPEYTGLRDKGWMRDDGTRIWTDLWDIGEELKPPRAARYLVHVRGWVKPVNGTATWPEFVQTDKDGELMPIWRRMPTVMLAKSALSLALRRSGVEALSPDVAVSYEGDSDDDLAASPVGETPGPDAHPPASGPGPTHEIVADDGQIFTCTCGRRFSSGGAFHRHRVEARHYDDQPPDDVYDDSPESRGYDPELQVTSYEDPGRPFEAS